ncbi:hypothetical protein GGI11_005380 [Coemansia sp. RSA 2049]|nr:hypothetical protein GGI11_005380 [Coemansia sp. RSA 2049]KAJ2510735.1 hypothetical protein H4217_007721 [Coemansia sp. RSA 1939]KAJ2596959.1 hypothetical protein EV177_007834 [Coemansia sp. RSA 1804]KAJ2689810.1 hypothetical protein GGH99_002743 [Coemansia sp. RSA 1285]
MRHKGLWSLAAAALMAGTVAGDIVLSVASPSNMDDYMAVLSSAWPTLYPKLEEQLQIAAAQVPAEYSYLWSLLSVADGAVPSTFDAQWAEAFVENAQALGPTTIAAHEIPGAESDPAAQPTALVSTNADGVVATASGVAVGSPTIVVAINGNVARNPHDAKSSDDAGSSDESAEESDGDDHVDSGAGSDWPDQSSSHDSSSSSSSAAPRGARPFGATHLLAAAAAAAIAGLTSIPLRW